MKEMTQREKEIYEYILQIKKRDGYPPCIRDIQNALEIKSTSTVHSVLCSLEEKGYIHRIQGKSRAVKIDGVFDRENGAVVTVPVLGNVAAGSPLLAAENCETYIDFPIQSKSDLHDELFALRVSGQSMIEDGILDGDIVIVRRRNVAVNGEIVVAMLDDGATVKRFYKENGRFRLQPSNKTMEPIFADEVMILGKVISVIRYYGN